MNRAVALLTGAIAVVGANSMVLAPITAAVARDLGGDPAEIVWRRGRIPSARIAP